MRLLTAVRVLVRCDCAVYGRRVYEALGDLFVTEVSFQIDRLCQAPFAVGLNTLGYGDSAKLF